MNVPAVSDAPKVEYLDFTQRPQTHALVLRNVPGCITNTQIYQLLQRFGGIESFHEVRRRDDTVVGIYKMVRVCYFARSSALAAKKYLRSGGNFSVDTTLYTKPLRCEFSNYSSSAAMAGAKMSVKKSLVLLNTEFPLLWSNTIESIQSLGRHAKQVDASAATTARELGLYCMDNSVLAALPPDVLDEPALPSDGGPAAFTAWGIDAVNATSEAPACITSAAINPVKLPNKLPKIKVVPGTKRSSVCCRVQMSMIIGTPQESTALLHHGGCNCCVRETVSPAVSSILSRANGLYAHMSVAELSAPVTPWPSTAIVAEKPPINAAPSWNSSTYTEEHVSTGVHLKTAVVDVLRKCFDGIIIRKETPASDVLPATAGT